MHRNILVFVLLMVATGCATTPPPQLPHPTREFPPDAFITQRGVLTALGKQYTLNGYLSRSATNGQRLVVTENFGNVMADVLVKSDGTVKVMRSSPMLRPKWIERYVAGDLKCIFGGGPEGDCPGQMVSPNHFVIERRWYKLDLQIVEVKAGQQPPGLFEDKSEKLP